LNFRPKEKLLLSHVLVEGGYDRNFMSTVSVKALKLNLTLEDEEEPIDNGILCNDIFAACVNLLLYTKEESAD